MINSRKRAAVSIEVAVGIVLSTVVVVAALALFNDNMGTMVSSTKVSNIYTDNGDKTSYSSYNRDYSNSQINVQIMGEQGLAMLRKKANNKAIELIEESFSPSNPNGSSIAYLAEAIKVITGEPHICAIMKNGSVEHCDDDSIGGYNYKVDINGSSLSLSKVANGDIANIIKTVSPIPFDNIVATAIGDIVIPLNKDNYPSLTTKEKYYTIQELTSVIYDYLRKDVVLLSVASKYSTVVSITKQSSDLPDALKTLANSISDSAYKAYDGCYGYNWFGKRKHLGLRIITRHGCFSRAINANDHSAIKYWASNFNPSNSINPGYEFYNGVLSIIDRLNDDNINNPTSCKVLINGINSINSKYNAKIIVPICK